MPSGPRKFDGANRPDETPKTFAELKPPGYWNGKYFVQVREVSEEEFWRDNDTLKHCIALAKKCAANRRLQPLGHLSGAAGYALRIAQ